MEVIVPLMGSKAGRRIALRYFTLGVSFADGCELKANTLLVGTLDEDFGVVCFARLKGCRGGELRGDESGLAWL